MTLSITSLQCFLNLILSFNLFFFPAKETEVAEMVDKQLAGNVLLFFLPNKQVMRPSPVLGFDGKECWISCSL